MPELRVVAKPMIAELKIAGVADRLLRRTFAGGQCRQRHEGLKRRARRISAGQRAVQHRAIRRVAQFTPALRIDAVDKQIRIKPRLADKRQHTAGLRVQRHQRAAPIPESFVHQRLQPRVQLEREVGAGGGRCARQHAHRAPRGIDLHLFHARGAVQRAFVAELQPGLADVIGTAIVGDLAVGVEFVELFLVDAADVTDHVRKQLALRILPEQPRLDFDAGKAIPVRRKARDFFIRQP